MILLVAAGVLLAVKDGWAAFRDGNVCRVVAEPVRRSTTQARPFAAVAVAPGRAPVLSFRLGHTPRDGRAMLTVGGKSVQLALAGDMARTADPVAIDGLRAGQTMTVRTRAGFEIYALRGAPTALDAALTACR